MSDADEVAEALAEVDRLNREAAELARAADSEPGTALLPAGGTRLPAEQVKATMIELRSQAAAKAAELSAARDRARGLIEDQKRALDARVKAMTDALAPLERRVDLLRDGLHAINLFIGTGEQLVQLADGEPAAAGEPIRVWQGVLAMDEESALDAETGGIDHLGVDRFDEWITADWGRVEQLIPAPRGVVAIMPRRSDKDYGDMWANQARNQLNHSTYLLIRNGRCLYRYIAEGFTVGRRLVPARDEFTSFFTRRQHNMATGGHDEVRIEPGTREWDRAEQAAGDAQRFYMMIALILQGLIERTACFHPLPAPGLSLLHPEAYEAGHIILIGDDEHALTTGRQPFYDWLAERNSQLRPGMRVCASFNSDGWQAANRLGREYGWGRHSRLHPQGASHPRTGEIYLVERRERDGALVVLYKRDDQVYKRNVPIPDEPGWEWREHAVDAAQRASVRLYPSDRFVIPVDLVTVDECEAYLRSRADRHAYIDMFPVLKAVIAAKRAEAAAEEPMRHLLISAIMTAHGASYEDAAAAVPGLVDWWKLANRWHRPLVSGEVPQAEARAIAAITGEYAARRAAVTDDTEPVAVDQIRTMVPGVMLVARRRDGSWVALEPQPRDYDREPGRVWAREHTWTKTVAGHRARDWVLPEPSRVARWRILWTGAAWGERDQAATRAGHLTDPEITALTAAAVAAAAAQAARPWSLFRHGEQEPPLGGRAAAVEHNLADGRDGRRFTVYWVPEARDDDDNGGSDLRLAKLTVRWRRTTGGQVATETSSLRPHEYSRLPWDARNPLTHTDPAGIADLEQELAERKAAEKARSALRSQAWTHQSAIAAQWTAGAKEAARRKFIGEYGDPALWPDHSKGMRWECPHHGYRGREHPWETAVERLVLDGADLGGLTVAEMAALHAAQFGEQVDVPEDIAGYRFPVAEAHGTSDE